MPKGIKYDGDKPRYELMPPEVEEEIVKVLTYGAIKYRDHNWKYVEPFYDRYYGACRRHLSKYRQGEVIDEENGYHHLAEAACCLIFMMHRDLENETDEQREKRESFQKEVSKHLKDKKEKEEEQHQNLIKKIENYVRI